MATNMATDEIYEVSDDEEAPSFLLLSQTPPLHPPSAQTAPAERVTNWTVKKPGKIQPPLTNDYSLWTIDQLRKECTQRKKKIPRSGGVEKDTRVSWLRADDAKRQLVEAAVDDENQLPSALRGTSNSTFRLLNVLFSDEFAERLGRSEDQATRADLDTRSTYSNSTFWKDVAVAFNTNTVDFNGLYVANDVRFAGVDASEIVPHDAAKLYKIWKELSPLYALAYHKSTQSGQHGDFLAYCDNRLDVAYLGVCVDQKPGLRGFARGGMPDSAKVDTLRPLPKGKAKRTARTSSVDADTSENDIRKTINRLTAFIERREAEAAAPAPAPQSTATNTAADILATIESISRTHLLLGQLKSTLGELEAKGLTDQNLVVSISLQEAGLRLLEESYAKRMGLAHSAVGELGQGENVFAFMD